MADGKRPRTPGVAKIQPHQAYDEAVEANDVDEIENDRLTLESIRPSVIRAAGTAGALTGAGANFGDDVTLESVNFPLTFERKDDMGYDAPLLGMATRHSEESFLGQSVFSGTGIAPGDWRLESQGGSEYNTEDEETSDDSAESLGGKIFVAAYDPSLYNALPVTPAVKALFPSVLEFNPLHISMEYKLMPFIPEMVPSIGDIDAFLKLPRPDGKQEVLGLTVLDEPSIGQSDPMLFDLRLRALAKGATGQQSMMAVKTLTDADDANAINEWIANVEALRKDAPPARVHYTNPMPDLDQLMQAWPPDMEKKLAKHSVTIPSDKSLDEAVDAACAILDIPIHQDKKNNNGKIQSLHLMMTLFLEFKESQHFGEKV